MSGFLAIFKRELRSLWVTPLAWVLLCSFLLLQGGIFYSIGMRPTVWQKVSLINPILYLINAFHSGTLGVSDISLWSSYAIIFGFIAALLAFSLYLLNKGHGIRT